MSRQPPAVLRATVALVVMGFATLATPLSAHPAAATEVALTLAARQVDVAFATGGESLALKLASLSGAPLPARLQAAPPCERIRYLEPTLLQHVELGLGNDQARLTLTRVNTGPDGRVAVQMTALVPADVKVVRWRTSLAQGSYLVVVRDTVPPASEERFEWLQGSQWSTPHEMHARFATDASWPTRVRQRFILGFTHIVPDGLDHILFVLGLFLLSPRLRLVAAQATAFTAAHSITLALTLSGVIALPAAAVEPLIALSIAYVAFENLRTSELRSHRLVVVFVFGLLHGMGFAAALSRFALPGVEYWTTLIAFNLGVEAGQLAVIGAARCVVRACRLSPAAYRRLIVQPASGAIGVTGVVWTVQRLM